jgi:predicted RNA-binding Zn ribbon-like protein
MFKLDNTLLEELGLGGLPPEEKNRMLAHIYETLEMRVGMKLAEQMTNEQLDEFESFIDKNDEAGALKWLETNFPNYKQVVADELEKLKLEIKASAPQIVAAAAQAQQQPQPQVPPQKPPQTPPVA